MRTARTQRAPTYARTHPCWPSRVTASEHIPLGFWRASHHHAATHDRSGGQHGDHDYFITRETDALCPLGQQLHGPRLQLNSMRQCPTALISKAKFALLGTNTVPSYGSVVLTRRPRLVP
jgi:hypothetical protein